MLQVKWLAIIFVSTFIIGCSQSTERIVFQPDEPMQPTPTLGNSRDRSTSHLRAILNDECALLHWQGVVLDRSNALQVLWWVEHNPNIIEFKTYDVREKGGVWITTISGQYLVSTKSNSHNQVAFTLRFSRPPGNTLESIGITLDAPVTLGELVEQCGEPSLVTAYVTYGLDNPEDYWTIELWWQENGLFVSTGGILGSNASPPSVDTELPLNEYLGVMTDAPASQATAWKTYSAWQGYQSFDFYEVENPL